LTLAWEQGEETDSQRQHLPNTLTTSTSSLSPTIFPSVLSAVNLLSALDMFSCTKFLLPNNPTLARKQFVHGRQIKQSSNISSCMTQTNPAKGLKRLRLHGTNWEMGRIATPDKKTRPTYLWLSSATLHHQTLNEG
jgi:hypothetical protein